MSAMKPQVNIISDALAAVQSNISSAALQSGLPQLQLPPAATTRTNDNVMGADHIDALQQWAAGLQGVLQKDRQDSANKVASLQKLVADLQTQLADLKTTPAK